MSIPFIVFGWVFIVASAFWLVWFWKQRPQKNVPIDDVCVCESCGGEADHMDDEGLWFCRECLAELTSAEDRGEEASC